MPENIYSRIKLTEEYLIYILFHEMTQKNVNKNKNFAQNFKVIKIVLKNERQSKTKTKTSTNRNVLLLLQAL